MPNLRLIPVVVFAAICLLAIKTVGFVGGGAPAVSEASTGGQTWRRIAARALNADDVLITGATPETKPAAPQQQPPMAALPKTQTPGAKTIDQNAPNQSVSERALIERLQERRQELDAKSRDLEMRENLIKAAEKQLDTRIEELKELEGKGGESVARIKNIVVMYESMGPKEAARVFDRMDPKTLVELVNQMNPRKVSEILAKMQPEAAERLTMEMARRRPGADKAMPTTDLRRIDAKNAQ
jgi:flagellar motility protein MotE (MotC chaperone)